MSEKSKTKLSYHRLKPSIVDAIKDAQVTFAAIERRAGVDNKVRRRLMGSLEGAVSLELFELVCQAINEEMGWEKTLADFHFKPERLPVRNRVPGQSRNETPAIGVDRKPESDPSKTTVVDETQDIDERSHDSHEFATSPTKSGHKNKFLATGVFSVLALTTIGGWSFMAKLNTLQDDRDHLKSLVDNLTESNASLVKENFRLTSIDNAMDLIETLDFDEQPKAMPFLSAYLANYEPSIFYKSADGTYDVCRILADRVSLGGETDFVSEFKGARKSFDMVANVAGMVKEHLPIIEEGLENGVSYRLILSDYRPENNRLDPFLVDVREGGAAPARDVLRVHHAQIEALKQRVHDNPKFTGHFDVKWNRKTLLYTMWIRDGATPNAIAHLGVHFYGGKPTWPSLRVSRKTANDVVDSWLKEFNVVWKSAEPYDAIPAPAD